MAKLPDKIDKYRIEELVAEGGMGAVFKGIHPTLNRAVILKKLTLRGNANITQRFKREARILLDFRNDNIVDVQDHFIQGRSHYIVMEYIDGPSVKELIEDQRYLDNCTAAYIALYTAKALKYAHSKGVVHRDIKPGNILISKTGEIKLADFGIASARDPDTGEDTLTTDGTTLGTPAYMAPEQFENSKTVDYRADLYSLGVMMYEMMTGQKPFPGGFTPDTIRMIQKGKYKKVNKLNPSAAPGLQRIIDKLIKPNPKRRFKNVDSLIERLEKWLSSYKEEDLKEHLCSLLREETTAPLKAVKTRHTGRIISLSAAAVLIAALTAGFCSLTDMHKRFLQPEEYGQIRFTADKPASNIRVEPFTTIFIDDAKDIPSIDMDVRYIAYKEDYLSLPMALPAGRYRAKTMIGDKIIWSSFRINPWAEKGAGSRIDLYLPKAAPAPVSVTAGILDASSGWDLSEKASLEVFADNKFRPVSEVEIISDAVYNFRISAEGYEEQEWVLSIRPEQKTLHFQTEMIPQE